MERAEFLQLVNTELVTNVKQILERFACGDAIDMISQGKRLRASLVYSLGQKSDTDSVVAAAAIELLHASTLVHDDIIDHASTRRGKPTISQKYGIDTAILVGNALLMQAVELGRRSMSPELQAELHELYIGITAAQNDELLWRGKLRSESLYREICDGKTGLLFRFCARVAGADRLIEQIVSRIAYAFQIVDDIDDLVMWRGESESHGSKLADYDINLGNITLPAILALEHKGVVANDFDMDMIEMLNDADWQYGMSQSRIRAARLTSESRECMMKIPQNERAKYFAAWAEPMMQQLESKTARIDQVKLG